MYCEYHVRNYSKIASPFLPFFYLFNFFGIYLAFLVFLWAFLIFTFFYLFLTLFYHFLTLCVRMVIMTMMYNHCFYIKCSYIIHYYKNVSYTEAWLYLSLYESSLLRTQAICYGYWRQGAAAPVTFGTVAKMSVIISFISYCNELVIV